MKSGAGASWELLPAAVGAVLYGVAHAPAHIICPQKPTTPPTSFGQTLSAPETLTLAAPSAKNSANFHLSFH